MNAAQIGELVLRIQGDFLDDPRLRLTAADAERRYGVTAPACEAVLTALADATVLARTTEDRFVRFFPHRSTLVSQAA
jgi:hypothetical protein